MLKKASLELIKILGTLGRGEGNGGDGPYFSGKFSSGLMLYLES